MYVILSQVKARKMTQHVADCPGCQTPDLAFASHDHGHCRADALARAEDIARERGLLLDMAGFERGMAAQRERARAHSQFGQRQTADLGIAGCTEFHGYDRVEETATVLALFRDGQAVKQYNTHDEA